MIELMQFVEEQLLLTNAKPYRKPWLFLMETNDEFRNGKGSEKEHLY